MIWSSRLEEIRKAAEVVTGEGGGGQQQNLEPRRGTCGGQTSHTRPAPLTSDLWATVALVSVRASVTEIGHQTRIPHI